MATTDTDQEYMALALDLARKGLGRTSPNPCVGAVIVREDKIVGSGYHRRAGTPHAEIHALHQAGSLASGSTLYVTLEPCNHTGRTPPCSHAVAESGINRVVMGMLDPNPLVAGGGRQYLIDNGIEVATGVLEPACRRLNEVFIKYITTKRPLVVIKAGVSLDGRLNYQKGCSGWITGPDSLLKVHQLRDCYDAILVGRGTVEIDNPSLTTRLQDSRGRDPLRLVVDSHLSISPDARMLNQQSEAETWIFCTSRASLEKRKALERKGA
ncbi:MAG TPA: bifunctional diaminohydroxyphosphoribosylaminopyrimidine deaminase/5-amino-6-(5-phosphoribosylamino)uracil reductase RibD, partial [Desulfopila sp.]|nr:bifunctional diaminohydroxyphosphoribosylaminopyrimidine deaminase/5-amino-6-(5-phosphoribosylamino)uracil reductase RibD [Desulfopila sp.]